MSQSESGIQRIAEPIMDFFFNGRVTTTQGNRNPGIAPHGYFKTVGEDQWIAITIRDNEEWSRFRKYFSGETPKIEEEIFDSLTGRVTHQDHLEVIIENWPKSQDSWALTKRLQEIGIPAYPVMDAPALIDDPNLNQLHRSHVDVKAEHLDENELFRGIVWKLSVGRGEISDPMPTSGQHNDQILLNLLKYDNDEATNFRQRGII